MADVEAGVENALNRIASEQGFKDYKLKITPVSTGGANYSSTLYTAKIEDSKNEINLFVKVAILTTEVIAAMGIVDTDKSPYEGEKYFNGEVSRIFREIEDKHKVPEGERYIFPKYYGDNTDKIRDILVFEDLGTKGFTTYDRFKSIDWPYASAAVKELAKFHALSMSMAFEKEYPVKYVNFIDKYNFPGFTKEIFEAFFIAGFNTSIGAVKEENREKLKKFLDNITLPEVAKMYEPVKKKVLIHTDFRPSNLMHKYLEDGTIQVIPIDYQTFQESCPVIDLMYFVFAGSDEEFRRQHFHPLMEHYYTELSAAMTRLGIDKSSYSRDDFDQDLKEKLKYGLVFAAEVLPIVTVDPNDAPKITSDLSTFSQFNASNMLVDRINGVVNDFIRWGIL